MSKRKATWRVYRRPDKKGEAQWVVAYRLSGDGWREHRIPREAKIKIDDQAAAEQYAKRFVCKLGAVVIERASPANAKGGEAITFQQFAEQWTSGELHEQWPDHVPLKISAYQDVARFKNYIYPLVGDVPLAAFSLEHAEHVMRELPGDHAQATRRHTANLMHRVLAMAVYPARLIQSNPLPRGFLPRRTELKAFSFLYPNEDGALLGCGGVPLEQRLLYGFLAREGLRLGEALALCWADLDLQLGTIRLDENKTDDPRMWALDPSVARALKAWWKWLGKPERSALVFTDAAGVGITDHHIAELFREHLELAGVKRPELFERSRSRMPIRVHDLRATFVTLALANNRTETWVSDRTGDRSSNMIRRYQRPARSAAELGLGWLGALDALMPELRDRGGGGSNGSSGSSGGEHVNGSNGSSEAARPHDLPHRRPHQEGNSQKQQQNGQTAGARRSEALYWSEEPGKIRKPESERPPRPLVSMGAGALLR
jgi:integrase